MASTKFKRQATEGTFLPKPDTTDKVVAGTQMVAGALGTFGALAPVPFIKEAAEAASYVAQIVKDVKNNQEEFKFIAQDAHHFVDKINQACIRVQEEEGKLPGNLVIDLKDFVDTLNKIKGFAIANTHRRTFTRFFYKDLDPENIRRCREELANRFQTFAIQSSIQSRADLAAIRSDTKKILANQEDHRASSENNIAGASMLSPPPMSPTSPTRQRPTSAPPTHQQFSPLPSPSFSDTSDDPFAHMRHPGFPFNTPSQRQSQPVFNVTTNSNFNAPNSNVYNSGTVNTHFNVGSDNYGTTVNNYNYDGSSSVDRKMKKAERKVARKVGSPSSAQWMDDSNNQQGYYASRRGTD